MPETIQEINDTSVRFSSWSSTILFSYFYGHDESCFKVGNDIYATVSERPNTAPHNGPLSWWSV
jgi:hypothetical protein